MCTCFGYNVHIVCNSYNTSMRFVSDLYTQRPSVQPKDGVFTNQIQPHGYVTTALQ